MEDRWIEVYRYYEALGAELSTSKLADSITLQDMSLAEFGLIDDFNVTMTAYACGTDGGETSGSAWDNIKSNYGIGE